MSDTKRTIHLDLGATCWLCGKRGLAQANGGGCLTCATALLRLGWRPPTPPDPYIAQLRAQWATRKRRPA